MTDEIKVLFYIWGFWLIGNILMAVTDKVVFAFLPIIPLVKFLVYDNIATTEGDHEKEINIQTKR